MFAKKFNKILNIVIFGMHCNRALTMIYMCIMFAKLFLNNLWTWEIRQCLSTCTNLEYNEIYLNINTKNVLTTVLLWTGNKMTVLSVELFVPPDGSEILLRVYRHFPPITEKADDAAVRGPGGIDTL